MAEQDLTQQEQPAELLASVIVLSYRRGETLRRCLQALEASHQRERLQVIVLDVGAHDTTPATDLEYPQVEFLRMPRNFGATKALNIGIRGAKAELLLLLDPAVELAPDTVARLAALLEEKPEAAAVCPLLVDGSGQVTPQAGRLPTLDMLQRVIKDEAVMALAIPDVGQELIPVEYAGRKALMVRRAFLKGMNYFDVGYGEWGADVELAFQIRHAGKKIFIASSIRAMDRSNADPMPEFSASQRAALAADRFLGAAHYVAKRAGFFAGLRFRIFGLFSALGSALSFQAGGWKLFAAILAGQKIDGAQSGFD